MKTWPSYESEPSSSLTVAAIQADPTPGDVGGNAKTGARLASVAADQGARLAVLPELFLPAYHPPTLAADPATDVAAASDRRVCDARLDPLGEVARTRDIVIVVGAAVRHADGRRTCSSLVIGRDGQVVVGYDKQHLWGPDENSLFTAGSEGATLTTDGWRFGLGICYDGCFPEHGRAAAVAGADGYLIPSGYLVGSEHRRDVYYAARALDNTMFVVFSNSVGGDAPFEFNGGSAIYEPEGRALCKAPDAGECVIVADLSRDDMMASRADHSMLADRRAELGGRRFLVA